MNNDQNIKFDEALSALNTTVSYIRLDDSERMKHWRVTIRRGNTYTTFVYSGGSAVEINSADAFTSILLDRMTVADNVTFKEWADNFGYNDDSIKALRLYEECTSHARSLEFMFSADELLTLEELTREVW
jgi:hypothetical protein